MKALLSCLAIAAGIFLSACTKDDVETSYSGTTQNMPCFGRLGIKTFKNNHPDSVIYILPDNLPSRYEKEGVEVVFNAELRANQIPLSFPDPSLDLSVVYQANVSNVRQKTR